MSQPMHPTAQSVRIWHKAQADRCRAIYMDGALVINNRHALALARWYNRHLARA